jgi:hypothetical protein
MAGLLALAPAMAQATPAASSVVAGTRAAAGLPPVGEVEHEPLAGDIEFTAGSQRCSAHVASSVEEDVTAQNAAHTVDAVVEKDLRMRGSDTCARGRFSGLCET